MSWRTRLIAIGFVAALLLAGVLVPRVPGMLYVYRVPWDRVSYHWVWTAAWIDYNGFNLDAVDLEAGITLWWLVALEELAIVLLGGLALAWSVRRDRRRRDTLDADR